VLDMALWDALAKAKGVPLWRLLADRYRGGEADPTVVLHHRRPGPVRVEDPVLVLELLGRGREQARDEVALWDALAKAKGVPLWRLLADRYRGGEADPTAWVYAAGGYRGRRASRSSSSPPRPGAGRGPRPRPGAPRARPRAGAGLWRLLADRYRGGEADPTAWVYAAGGYYYPGKGLDERSPWPPGFSFFIIAAQARCGSRTPSSSWSSSGSSRTSPTPGSTSRP
jgi:hypothetical protein